MMVRLAFDSCVSSVVFGQTTVVRVQLTRQASKAPLKRPLLPGVIRLVDLLCSHTVPGISFPLH